MSTEEKEEWRPVPSDPEMLASSLGRVARISQARKPAPRGYLMFSVYRQGKKQKAYVIHRLVAEAFHGRPPSSRHEVRHLDGNKMNNRQDNLAWGTSSENKQDRLRHGTDNRGSKHGMSKLTEMDVRNIRKSAKDGVPFRWIAQEYGISHGAVSHIHRRTTWGWLD